VFVFLCVFCEQQSEGFRSLGADLLVGEKHLTGQGRVVVVSEVSHFALLLSIAECCVEEETYSYITRQTGPE
jgi:hypothetical protein